MPDLAELFLNYTLVIKQLKMLNIRLQQLSRVDNLTGVANRIAFNECRQQEVPRPQGWAAHDRGLCRSRPFQTVNDSFGHGVVNVLVASAQTMSTHIRHTDIVARIEPCT
jgi:GGDEF domain-containing protein